MLKDWDWTFKCESNFSFQTLSSFNLDSIFSSVQIFQSVDEVKSGGKFRNELVVISLEFNYVKPCLDLVQL